MWTRKGTTCLPNFIWIHWEITVIINIKSSTCLPLQRVIYWAGKSKKSISVLHTWCLLCQMLEQPLLGTRWGDKGLWVHLPRFRSRSCGRKLCPGWCTSSRPHRSQTLCPDHTQWRGLLKKSIHLSSERQCLKKNHVVVSKSGRLVDPELLNQI